MLPAPLRNRQRWVTPEPLNVAPPLIGLPLATPAARAWAMGVDLLVVALLSTLNDAFLALGLLAVVWMLRRPVERAEGWRRAAGWVVVALFVGIALHAAWKGWHEREPAEPVEARTLKQAREVGAGLPDAERIAMLEGALADALKPRPVPLGEQVESTLESVGASFGWGVVYFSLLPAFWGGQTVGKRLFGLRVLEITGQPMTVMRSLKRYGGYAAGMATGGLGFVQVLWDPNRQGLQDRAAHTVVIDTRAPRLTDQAGA